MSPSGSYFFGGLQEFTVCRVLGLKGLKGLWFREVNGNFQKLLVLFRGIADAWGMERPGLVGKAQVGKAQLGP